MVLHLCSPYLGISFPSNLDVGIASAMVDCAEFATEQELLRDMGHGTRCYLPLGSRLCLLTVVNAPAWKSFHEGNEVCGLPFAHNFHASA
ncbi:hypothetical protein Dimus_016873 [Dionaea muscipula]